MKTLFSLIFICCVLCLFNFYILLKKKQKYSVFLALLFFISSFRYILIYLFLNVKKLNYLFNLGKLTLMPVVLFTIGLYCIYILNRKSEIGLIDKLLMVVFLILEVYIIYIVPNNFIKYYGGFKFVCTNEYRDYLILLVAFFALLFIFIASNYFRVINSVYFKVLNLLYIIGYLIFLIQAISIYVGMEFKTMTLIPEVILLIAAFLDISST
ncbi:MAG: hypothetical protein JG776_1976 [Caloramator sp.]|nr:hypothetical protein [Caloramator sp.]